MYFGSRLLAGELIWTKEFHDKLPFVPFIFLVPAYFKSVYVFKIISIISIFIFSCLLLYLPNKIFTKTRNANERLVFSSLVFFLLLYFSYDSIETINCIAVSFYGASFLLILYDSFSSKVRTLSDKCLVLFFGSCFGAMAISIRPYYIAGLGVALVGSIFLSQNNVPAGDRLVNFRKFLKSSAWGVAIGVWGGVLNVLPYALTGQMSAFHDGLSMLSEHINPHSGVHDFFERVRKFPDILLWGSWILIAVYIFYLSKLHACIEKCHEYKIFWASTLSALATVIYVVSQHYWWHYIQLFFANYCICIACVLCLIQAPSVVRIPFKRNLETQTQFLYRIFLTVACVFLLFELKKEISISESIRNKNTVFWQSTRYNWQEDLFRDYLEKRYANSRPSFLFPDDMKAHWLLGESRHHFPHSANTWHIFVGWWKNITFRSPHFFVMSNGEQYCEKIRSNGPDMIVVQPDSLLLPCMRSASSGYQMESVLENPVGKIVIFRRTVQP
jgi:hypothetical protein